MSKRQSDYMAKTLTTKAFVQSDSKQSIYASKIPQVHNCRMTRISQSELS